MRTRLLVAAVAATASLAACGGGEEPTSGADGREAANRKALLDFARCMRSNGVNMPDPQFEAGGRVTQRMGPGKVDAEAMRKADKACAKYRESIKAPEMSDADKEKFRKAALEHSRCMREQGIDMPDPQFDENGGAQIRIGRSSGINPDDPKFKQAQEACRDKMPRLDDEDEQ
jgi:hypothetical protein